MADDLSAPERVRLAALDEYGWDWPSPAPDDDPSAVTYVRADIYEALESLNRGQEEQLEIQGNELARRASHGHALRDRIEALERERDEARAGNHSGNEHEPTWRELCDYWKQRADAAEAALATARADALREAEAAVLPEDDIAWRGSWYEPALRAAQARILALIDGGRT